MTLLTPTQASEAREMLEFAAWVGEYVRKSEIERVRFEWGDNVADAIERAQKEDS